MDGNGDGGIDLVHVEYLWPGMRIHTLSSNGRGTWPAVDCGACLGFAASDVRNWRAMDVNGDGAIDLVHVEYLWPGIRIHTLFSNGNGTWTAVESDAWPGFAASDVRNWRAMDVNGDGAIDLVHVEYLWPGIRIHPRFSNGNGT